MNPIFQMVPGLNPLNQQPARTRMINPIQRANYIYQAMRNPVEFVKQQFPDVPEEISNDPNQILDYLRRTRGISDEQLRQILNPFPMK